MIEKIALLRNVGLFDSVDAGAQLPFSKLTLVHAENGRGKTTLAVILQSLGTGDAGLIASRRRLSAQHPPHIVLNIAGNPPFIFQNGAWSASFPRIAVYDDMFVAQNVCSGIEIEAEHRQNLHELILGARGVTLNATLQTYVTKIEEHNRGLRMAADAIPAAARGSLTADEFCALCANPKHCERHPKCRTKPCGRKSSSGSATAIHVCGHLPAWFRYGGHYGFVGA